MSGHAICCSHTLWVALWGDCRLQKPCILQSSEQFINTLFGDDGVSYNWGKSLTFGQLSWLSVVNTLWTCAFSTSAISWGAATSLLFFWSDWIDCECSFRLLIYRQNGLVLSIRLPIMLFMYEWYILSSFLVAARNWRNNAQRSALPDCLARLHILFRFLIRRRILVVIHGIMTLAFESLVGICLFME